MSSANSSLFYHVYLPEHRDYFRVEVPSDPLLAVSGLARGIKNHNQLRKVLQPNEPFRLYKYCKRYKKPSYEFHNGIVKWLQAKLWGNEHMMSGSLLSDHFPCGPAPIADEQIDVIIVTDSFSKTLRHVAPENQARPDVQFTPRNTSEETRSIVLEFLKQYDDRLREYIAGPAWRDLWEAPSTVDEQTRNFIDGLRIPMVNGVPALLVHDLGKDVVDPGLVNQLFSTRTRSNKFLVNTSGSGKTRLLFEGLTKHWGFYYTTVVNKSTLELGSDDVVRALDMISNSKGFKSDPSQLPADTQRAAFEFNDTVAQRRVHQILTARLLVFGHFLEVARELNPTGSLNGLKQHWLSLQLCSLRIFRKDLFGEVAGLLRGASDEFLLSGVRELHSRLVDLQKKFSLDRDFFLVLDEAQRAIDLLPNSFRSPNSKDVKHPVLKPIVDTFIKSTSFPIVVSGTGLSVDVVNDVVGSGVGKCKQFILETRTGAFDDMESQRKYILRYMPDHVAQTASGKALIERAWNFARGRHRFTAVLMSQLLLFNYQSPHKIFNEVIFTFSKSRPTDAQHFVEEEQDVPNINAMHNTTDTFKFEKIINNPILIREISTALHYWIMFQSGLKLIELRKPLVELGFARFGEAGDREAYVDEPLVLLAAAHEFDGTVAHSVNYNMHSLLLAPGKSSRGENIEIYIGYYLACAFDKQTRLCDIFDFGDSPPKFAEEAAELVSIVFTDHGVEASRFNLLDREGATSAIGFDSENREATMKWLTNPSTVMCFPDNLMGPDIVLFIRVAGVIMAVLVQCKWLSSETVDARTLREALGTLDIEEIWQRGNQTDEHKKAGKDCAFDLLRRLNGRDFDVRSYPGMEWDGWLQNGMPVLRVLASYPAVLPERLNSRYYTVLNMNQVEKRIDKWGVLKRTRKSILAKRGCDEDKEANPPSKKPRA